MPVRRFFKPECESGKSVLLCKARDVHGGDMIRKTFFGMFALSSLVLAQPHLGRDLFNGKDFEGWEFDIISSKVEPAEIWTVEDGMIVSVGRPLSVLRTTEGFENYELTLEWRWPEGSAPGNSGVLLHATSPRERGVWPKSIEVQLAHGSAGDFWMIGESITVEGREPLGRRIPNNGSLAERSPGEWNQLRVRCEGASVTVWINGTLVNHGHAATAVRGAICLQSEGADIHFRNLRILPLPAEDSP